MKKLQITDTIQASQIVLGCMRISQTKCDLAEILETAYDCGINFFDHADIVLSRAEWYDLYRSAGNTLP